MSFIRPTALAHAFVTAAASAKLAGKVDHSQASWVPRRVIHNATERGSMFGMVHEFDHRPNHVQANAAPRVMQEDDGFSD